ncbi:hypothetical protein KP509_20G018700 [Ceratopteris richardii]|uniref:RING-type domain-containing protein n=1 Tax=Ceratopteris richardii TaxID=49495 RepID=A0A8T2SDK0_CERRI|nr:hypothetical protein KP509_20G018700 [Ceratopteris richardii]
MACPFVRSASRVQSEDTSVAQGTLERNDSSNKSAAAAAVGKCPLGYDSGSFKLGPFSCVICRALLFQTSKCVPCGHIFCRLCISRFEDCPLCGAGIESLTAHDELQQQVDQFIEGHARVKRSIPCVNEDSGQKETSNVMYEDVSLERGSFLVQQAMRAFQAQNLESASARLELCAADIKEELERHGPTPEICSQLGAVLGMLGDCSRSMGSTGPAISYYNESVEMLSKLPVKDSEVVHALSVSINKMGDLEYYAGDLTAARAHYAKSLDVRRSALQDYSELSSQVLDIAVSLAKVADVDRALGNNGPASEGFQEAIKMLENLSGNTAESGSLERRRLSILEFLHGQTKDA